MVYKRVSPVILLLSVWSIFAVSTASAQVGWTKSYDNAVVVTAEKHASEVGKQILKQGGNAVDAAVAVQFALAVTLPRAGNIGGGGFMVIHRQDTTVTLDYREVAPTKASRDIYIREGEYQPDLSRRGVLAVGVPGVVDGMIRALDRFGKLSLETVMAPAIRLARKGYRLPWLQAQELNDKAEELKEFESSRRYFTRSSGEPYEEGDLFIQTDLASTLERIAQKGRDGFYSGKTAELIIREMQQHGGLITYKDLSTYESRWREPVRASFGDFTLHMMGPPSSGSIAIGQMVGMLQSYELEQLGFNSARYIHLLTEVMRRAFADRAHFPADPDFVDIPVGTLLSESYLEKRMSDFSWKRATESSKLSHGRVSAYSESPQTTHFSIVDGDGNAVSVTTTLNGSFGSKVAVSGAGFLLNNEMDDFTAKPGEPNMYGLIQGEANAIEPGKRMLSSMTPTIVTQGGKVRMVLGAAGGPRIINTVLQTFLNITVFEMNAQAALDAPRFHHQWLPDTLYYEEFGISSDTRLELQKKGHATGAFHTHIGRSHIIHVDEQGKKHGAASPRANGYAAGY